MGPASRSGDRFIKKAILGEGGAGRVWLIEDRERPGREIALKELTERGSAQHEDAFRREFATLACLHHPNLPEVDEFDTSPETALPRFTLELIEGSDIVEAVRREGPGLFLDLAVEALRALAFLHDFDLIHGDLKPANLLVRDRPKLGCRLVIVDFGLALPGGDAPTGVPAAGGTLAYMAPELLANRAATRRSDLYALGAVLFEAACGRPWSPLAATATGGLVREVQAAPSVVPELPATYPAGTARWLADLLAPEPDRRPSGAVEALARLNAACGTSFPPETAATRTARLLSGPPAEREEGLAAIRRALDPSSGPRIVWLAGGPGSGKSRILRWLEAEAILRGYRVAAVYARSRVDLPALRASAAARPTLLLLDDVHAAGKETIELLERVAREPAAPPLQVVAALRPDAIVRPAVRTLLGASETAPALRRVDLGPIDAAGVRAMAVRATGGPVAEERVGWLVDACDGSPAAAEALLIEGAWERGGRARAPGVRDGVAPARLAMISADAALWLEAVAALRRSAREADAAELSGLSPARARAASEEAAAAGLVVRKEGRWFPVSSALADRVLAEMDAGRRADLHRRAAELIGSRDDADPLLVATLLAGFGAIGRAVARAEDAARDCERSGDPAGAAACYGHALRLLGRRRESRHRLRLAQARALARAGMHAAAARACGAAVRVADSEADRTAALALRALALVQAGRFPAAIRAARRVADRAAPARDLASLAQARRAEGTGLGRLGREREAVPLLEEARRLSRARGDARGEAEALHALAACKTRLGGEDAAHDLEEAVALFGRASAQDDPPQDGQDLKARIGLAVLAARARDYGRAAAMLEEARAAAAAGGNLGLQESALSKLAMIAIDQGKLDRAMELAAQAADLALHLGDHNLILVNRCGVADARIRCGRAGEAVAELRRTLELPLKQIEPDNVDYARMLLADAWMESGGAGDAEPTALLERTLARCRERGKRRAWLMALVIEMERRARADSGEPFEPVLAEYAAVAAGAEEPPEAEIRIRAALAEGAHALARGGSKTARERAGEAAATAREAGFPAFEARAEALAASAFAREGRDRDAGRALDRGRELLERAAVRIDDEAVRRDFLARPVYSALRPSGSGESGAERGRLAALYDMIRVLNTETDAEGLLETILDLALRAVSAERGMIFLREDREGAGQGEFSVRLARDLERETVGDALAFSRRIVASAGEGRSILAVDAGTDERFRGLRSVSLHRIRSLMCVPLRSRGRIVGTVYLDSRTEGRLFTQDDLRFVEALADQAALAIENSRMRERLLRENRQLLAAAEARTSFANLVGRSPGMRAVFSLIEKVAATDLPVLIRGESGTGKELVARAIHAHGPRRRRPFLGENCAAIPDSLLESELFGHVRGAFTGAERARPGLFEQADGGTLFLDEVGDMPLSMQARLLRVVEGGQVRRVGGERPVPVDVRIVGATHRDLGAEVRAGRFRQDLLFRLQVLTIEMPPLRERPGDVPLLVAHVLARIAAERGRDPWVVDDEAMGLFERYPWPGNVRELQNALQRLALLAGNRTIGAGLIASDPVLRRTLVGPAAPEAPELSLASAERERIRHALAAAGGNRRKASGLLGISRATLYRKLARHGL